MKKPHFMEIVENVMVGADITKFNDSILLSEHLNAAAPQTFKINERQLTLNQYNFHRHR